MSNGPTRPQDRSQGKSRREFVKASAAVGAAAWSAAAQAGTAESGSDRKRIETDVLVCGAGCAGVAAALSAARNGAKVLLVERAPFAGGIITCVGLPYFDGIADIHTNRIVVRGIPLELLSKSGVCAPDAMRVAKHNPTIPNTFQFKLLLDSLLRKQAANLTILFNSFVCDVETTGSHVKVVRIANKDGLVDVIPRVVVDCTGDADVAAWAGAPFEQNAEVQPLTLHFRVGNVGGESGLSAECRESLTTAQNEGKLPHFYGPGVMFLFAKGEVYVHGIRVPANPTDAADLTRAEMQGRADAWAMFEAWKRDVPAFKDSYFIEAYPWIGIRESRRIVGRTVLSEDDLSKSRRFDDAIATGCWYFDLHPNQTTLGSANDFKPEKAQPHPYDIPFASLVPQKVDNLLVAGRCHSATRGAHSSTRVTATAMAMGEAAGLAASMAVKERTEAAAIDGRLVRKRLAQQNAGPFTDA